MRPTGQTEPRGVGRPAEIWEVVDRAPLEERLAAVGEELRVTLPNELPSDLPEVVSTDATLAVAENELVFATRARDPVDAATFARHAIAILQDTGISLNNSDAAISPPGTLVTEDNLTEREARASIVGALAEFIVSDEASGLGGPLWRHAFRRLSSGVLAQGLSVQQHFLIDLVRIADERITAHDTLRRQPRELADWIVAHLESSATTSPDSQDDIRPTDEHTRLALACLIAEIASGARDLSADARERLHLIVRQGFAAGGAPPSTTVKMLVDGLCELALSDDGEAAGAARETLLVIRQPRSSDFWYRLRWASPDVSMPKIFEGLAHIDLAEAFSYLQTELAESDAVEDVRNVLITCLPALDYSNRTAAQDHFAEFLATVPVDLRIQFAPLPTVAGLTWQPAPFERLLVRHFLSILMRWRAYANSDSRDPRVLRQTEALARELKALAAEVLLLMSRDERRRLSQVLAVNLFDQPAASLCVPLLLELGLESDVARSVIESAPSNEEAWTEIADWYWDVCPRSELDAGRRNALIAALRAGLKQYGDIFLFALAKRALSEGELLSELTDNPDLEPRIKLELEIAMTQSYGTAATDLEAVVSNFDESLE